MRVFIFLILTTIVACNDSSQQAKSPQLVVQISTELREQPDEKSRERLHLPARTVLLDLGETSRFLASAYLSDTLRHEPWLRVQVPGGASGWVFAAAVRPSGLDAAAERAWVMDKRAQGLFGTPVAEQLRTEAMRPPAETDTTFAQHFRAAKHLSDTLNRLLAYAVRRDAALVPADLSWLADYLPLFRVYSGTDARLALDFRQVAAVAAHTNGTQDDAFAEIGCAAFPLDSVESVLPAWVFPLSLETSCSNLGAGQHLALLEKLEHALTQGDLFRPELLALKNRILADVLDQTRAYWRPQDQMVSELNAILAAPLTCLSDRDRLALSARLAMFRSPMANGIRVNLRAGGTD